MHSMLAVRPLQAVRRGRAWPSALLLAFYFVCASVHIETSADLEGDLHWSSLQHYLQEPTESLRHEVRVLPTMRALHLSFLRQVSIVITFCHRLCMSGIARASVCACTPTHNDFASDRASHPILCPKQPEGAGAACGGRRKDAVLAHVALLQVRACSCI